MALATAPRIAHHGQPYQADELAAERRRNAELQLALEQAAAALAEATTARRELNEKLEYTGKVRRLSNKQLSAGARLTLQALYFEYDFRPERGDGWRALYLPTLAEQSGQSEQAVSSQLHGELAAAGLLEVESPIVPKKGGGLKREVRIRILPAVEHLQGIPFKRNHGGKREPTCKCGGTLELVKRYVCKTCHHIYKVLPEAEDSQAEDDGAENEAEPEDDGATRQLDRTETNNQRARGIPTTRQVDECIAAWLAEHAGDGTRHIEMQETGEHKYLWRGGAVTPALAAAHLAGDITIGATLRHADGRTLAYSFDEDDEAGADMLALAAVKLAESGAYVTYTESPARNEDGTRRGARLDVYLAEPVDAANLRATILKHAPELAEVVEYWPNAAKGNGQATRLPFARYRRLLVDAWCEVAFMDGERLTGLAAAERVFSADKTPAAWVTETAEPAAPASSQPASVPRENAPGSLVISDERVPLDADRPLPAAFGDLKWRAKFGADADTRWFAIVGSQAAAYFNARNNADAMVEVQPNGYALATWRGERTASVKLTDTNGFIDYGANATVKAGDALELHCLIHNRRRADVLADVARDMLAEGRRELEAAAAAGRGLPAWLHAITTPAGWRHYDALRSENQRGAAPPACAGQYRAKQLQRA